MEQEITKTNNEGNIILITGSNKGLGLGIARDLISKKEKNYKVILTSRNTGLGEASVAKLNEEFADGKDRIFYHQLDITDQKSINDICQWTLEKFGKIDVLVDNAGVAGKGPTFNIELYDSTFATNVTGTINLTEAFLREGLIRNNGKIMIMGSTTGNLARLNKDTLKEKFRNPDLNVNGILEICGEFREAIEKNTLDAQGWPKSCYAVSKMAINTYGKILGSRKDILDKNIGVYTCCPGWVKTDMAGPNAVRTIEEGVVTPVYLIELEPKINNNLQGKFFYDCKPTSYDS